MSAFDRWAGSGIAGSMLAVGVWVGVCLSAGCGGAGIGDESMRQYERLGDREATAAGVAYGLHGPGGETKLPADWVYARLMQSGAGDDVGTIFERVVEVEVADRGLLMGALVHALELDFVHSFETSSLDLLGRDASERFQSFAWHELDYPGGEAGPNEDWANALADSLDTVTPERRANRTAVSVITRDEASEAVWDYMLGQWREVPGEESKKLNRHAVEAYVAMRDEAAADGVTLRILSGHRDPQRAKAMAERAGNPVAVASFSSHSLGLAIDVSLPRAEGGRYRLSTRPMGEVVAMRRSPVHKWLHLHAHEFGWYPFQQEPWHWEYNPPGFRRVFFGDALDLMPARE